MLPRRLAVACALSTFALLVIGGTVNPTGSSLACPEPTLVCNGQLFPPMVGGVLYEHGHRLAAMTVGFLQLILTFVLLRPRHRPLGLTRLAWLTLAMVLVQGGLGAITVGYKLPWFVSTAHLLLGMSYFATLVYVAYRARPAPTVIELRDHQRGRDQLGSARRWIGIAVGAVMVQLLLGALVRHHGAALVCLGMPECTRDGTWLPANGVQQLHMLHRGFGLVVAGVTIGAAIAVLRAARSWSLLRLHMFAAPVVVIAQVALGIYTVQTVRSVPVAVGHFAGPAALGGRWVSAWILTGARAEASAGAAGASTSAPEPGPGHLGLVGSS